MINVAVVGKGGAGKTSIAGTMARVLARRGHRVLAIDGDPNPNLALTVGVPFESLETLPTLPRDLVGETEGPRPTMTLDDVCASYSVEGTDAVTLLVMANPKHAGTGCNGQVRAGVSSVTRLASDIDGGVCIVDTDATIEQFLRIPANALRVNVMVVAVEAYFTSLETARRMVRLGELRGYGRVCLVANKVRDERELDAVNGFARDHGLEVAGVVPYDDRLRLADWVKRSPLDFDPNAPAIAAIDELATRLVPLRT